MLREFISKSNYCQVKIYHKIPLPLLRLLLLPGKLRTGGKIKLEAFT